MPVMGGLDAGDGGLEQLSVHDPQLPGQGHGALPVLLLGG